MIAEETILTLIPQRPPFVMIDQLTYSDDTSSRSSFLVKEDNIFVSNGKLLAQCEMKIFIVQPK
jgi:hypothetical protein